MNSEIRGLFVIDILQPSLDEGKLFDSKIAVRPGLSFWPYFKKYLNDFSYDIVTINDFIKYKYFNYKIPFYGISYEGYSSTVLLFKKFNIRLTIIFSGEPAKNAPIYYLNFNNKIKKFENVIAFSGYKKFVKNKNIKFLNFYWPNSFSELNKYSKLDYGVEDFSYLKLVCFVASPKSRIPINYNRWISRLISLPRFLLYELIFSFFPIMNSVDLYKVRLSIIKSFLKYPDFFMFGNDWDQFISFNSKFKNITISNEIYPCDDKIFTIKDFRFCICIENTDFEGYITEKIFDALYANVIPVYLGNIKIYDFVPRNCFVDIRDFNDFDELFLFLKQITFDEWKSYIININKFLYSDDFKIFNNENFSKTLFDTIKQNN
jgi:hypothetical protein